MNDSAKVILAVGTGMVVGKVTQASSAYWWLLGGLTAMFVLNSPGTQRALKSGASSVYANFRK